MAQRFTRQQVAERSPSGGSKDSKETVFIIDNVVYDVTQFLDEHPGGHEVLVNVAGKDATEDFEDIGHSLDAKELMKKYRVGELVEEDRVQRQRRQVRWEDAGGDEPGFLSSWKFPLLAGVLLTLLYTYYFG